MADNTITIEWEGSPEDPSEVSYQVNGKSMGPGNVGFDHVLEFVRQHKGMDVVIRLGTLPLSAEDVHSALPFKRRLKELQDLVAPKHLSYDL